MCSKQCFEITAFECIFVFSLDLFFFFFQFVARIYYVPSLQNISSLFILVGFFSLLFLFLDLILCNTWKEVTKKMIEIYVITEKREEKNVGLSVGVGADWTDKDR